MAPATPPRRTSTIVWFSVMIVYAVIITASMIFWFVIRDPIVLWQKIIFSPGPLLFGVLIAYTIASIRSVREDQVGVKLFFGRPFQEVRPGPAFVPLFLCRLDTRSGLVEQREFPAEPQQIFHGDLKDVDGKIPDRMVLPIRITTGGSDPTSINTDPLNHRMTLEVSFPVRIRIRDIVQFVQTIGTFDAAFRNIEDVAKYSVQPQFASRTPAQVIHDMPIIITAATRAINDLLLGVPIGAPVGTPAPAGADWGLELVSFGITPPDIGKTVSVSLRNVPAASFNAQATIITAGAEAESIRLTGTQVAAVRQLFLEGESVGFQRIVTALGVSDPGQAVTILQSEAARDALAKAGNVYIYGQGTSNLLGLVDTVLQRSGITTPTPPGTTSTLPSPDTMTP